MDTSGVRYVKQAVVQGLAENLAIFLAKSGYDAIFDPGAPRVFVLGTSFPLSSAVNAEDMLNFYAASPTASQSTILTALQAKLEELCFTVLPDLRPLRCTAPQMLLIGEALRTTLYLPPVPITTTAVPTTTEQRAIIEVNLQEGLPAWAVGLLIVLIVLALALVD
eukprot:g31887.t1